MANEVVKGGSLGHGTAVPGHFDVDLVMYSTGELLLLAVCLDMCTKLRIGLSVRTIL